VRHQLASEGLMSRWITPCACAAVKPSATCSPIRADAGSASLPSELLQKLP